MFGLNCLLQCILHISIALRVGCMISWDKEQQLLALRSVTLAGLVAAVLQQQTPSRLTGSSAMY